MVEVNALPIELVQEAAPASRGGGQEEEVETEGDDTAGAEEEEEEEEEEDWIDCGPSFRMNSFDKDNEPSNPVG